MMELHPGPGVTGALLQPWLLGSASFVELLLHPGFWPTTKLGDLCLPSSIKPRLTVGRNAFTRLQGRHVA